MLEKLVSIVVPTFNRAKTLRRCLDSALTQTHRNVELILVDDGSTDNTRELISQAYGSEPRLKYVYQANQGVTAARNTGLKQCTGDFIALLDSDDFWEPWKLALQLACFARFPEVGLVWTDMRAIDAAGKTVHPAYIRKMYSCFSMFPLDRIFSFSHPIKSLDNVPPGVDQEALIHIGDVYPYMFFGSLVHTSTVLLSRERFETVGGFDPAFQVTGEDYDFHFRSCRAGPSAFIDVPTIEYQIGAPDQLTNPSLGRLTAANALGTIQKALRHDRDRINMPARLIRQRFAGVYAWLGEKQLDEGLKSAACASLARSLRYMPAQPRTARLLALACCPEMIGKRVRSIYRKMRERPDAAPAGLA